MKGPLAFRCPHCKAEPGYTCVLTWSLGTPYKVAGNNVQHTLRWMAAQNAAKAEGTYVSLEDWESQLEEEHAQDPLDGML
jgi:hypothetical protein